MTSRIWVHAAVAAIGAAAALVGSTSGSTSGSTPVAAPVAAQSTAAVAPTAFTLRHSGQGWAGVAQAGAAVLACQAFAPGCADGSDPTMSTGWVDVDADPSTMNSSRANLTIPPGAATDWAGLYWAGDRGQRRSGAAPRCDAAPEATTPATLPPMRHNANQVRVALGQGDGSYVTVTAGSLTEVTGPNGGEGFQAYADITALLRPLASPTAPAQIALTVADVQVARGPGCAGGWTVVLVYSYGDGPDRTYAPSYRSIAVFDGVVTAPVGVAQEIRLDGLVTPAQGDAESQLAVSLLASGQAVGADGLTVGGTTVALAGSGVTGGRAGPGYHLTNTRLANGAIGPGATAAPARVTVARNAFVAAVLGLSTKLPASVDLSISTEMRPDEVVVGAEAVLTVTVRNDADLPASGVVVTSRLPAGLTLVEAAPAYDAGTGLWVVGKVAAHASVALALRVRATTAGKLLSTAEVSASEITDIDSTPGDGLATQDDLAVSTLTAASPAPSPSEVPAAVGTVAWSWRQIPPAALFGTGLLALGLLMLSIVVIRRRAS